MPASPQQALLVVDSSFKHLDVWALEAALRAEAAHGVVLLYLTDGPPIMPTPHITQVMRWLRELELRMGPPSLCVTTFKARSADSCLDLADVARELGCGKVLLSPMLERLSRIGAR
jgi:hypothetical protein